MRYHPRRLGVPSTRIVLLSVAVTCGITCGCSLNRKIRITSGSVSVEYQKNEDISIRTPTLSVQLNSRHALFVSLLVDNRELSLAYKSQDPRKVPSDYVVMARRQMPDFSIDYSGISVQDVVTGLGQCKRIEIPSHAVGVNWSLRRVVDIDLCPTFPQSAILTASYRNTGALCPAYPPARDYMVQLAGRMIEDWKADGFYMDDVFTVPSCYNPVHHHASPYDSVRQLRRLFEEFREIIEQYNPQGMLMICPCGTTINHCLLPSTNEPVTADPIGSQQIRWRVKMYKALMGPTAPVFADRVESTQFKRIHSTQAEVGTDFASCLGTGGILGTIFVWPKIDKLPGDLEYRGELEVMERLLLTPEKAALWKKWFDLYRQKMLSMGEFLNLYTVGFDLLKGYVIRKQDRLFYAFFAPHSRPWGLEKTPVLPEPTIWPSICRLELRGLQKSKSYQVVDYERGKSLEQVDGATPYIKTEFTDHLLLEAIPLP